MQFIKNLFRTLKTAKRAMNFNFNQVGNSEWNPQLLTSGRGRYATITKN